MVCHECTVYYRHPFIYCCCHIRHLRKMMVGAGWGGSHHRILYLAVRIDLSTLKAHPKTAQSKHDLCVGLLSSKGYDHVLFIINIRER